MKSASWHPLICQKCDTGTDEEILKRWKAMCKEFALMKKEKFWFFFEYENRNKS